MKRTLFTLVLMFTLVSTLYLPITFAQDYTQLSLPEGAKARLGKGTISGNIAYSPDGTQLAVESSIGIWIYSAETGEELDLLMGHTDEVRSVAFNPNGQTLASGSSNGTVLLWEITPTSPEPEKIAEDVNDDGVVNIVDLTLVASNFGETGTNAADVNSDGVVNIVDLTLVAAAFGNTAAALVLWGLDSEIVLYKSRCRVMAA